jgi:hypothetical protein
VNAFRFDKTLQLSGVIGVAGKDEDLVVCGEGSEGLAGCGAAGGGDVGEGVGSGCAAVLGAL